MQVTIRTIVDAAYAMDGGSIYLEVLDAEGAPHSVLLVQHLIPENSSRANAGARTGWRGR